MTPSGEWLLDQLSRLLEPDERDAVRGDLAESRLTDGRAVRDLLGLVIRRQAVLWLGWRPWVALAAIVAPLGMVLSLTSRQWANTTAIYAWQYANNWTWGYIESPGARLDLFSTTVTATLQCLALVCWAWTIGYVLGSLSRRTLWLNGLLFAVVLFGGTLGSTTAGLRNPGNAAVFSLTVYRVAPPAISRIVLVLLPALHGMQKAFRGTRLPLLHALVWAGAVVILTAFAGRSLEVAIVWGWVPTAGPAVNRLAALRGSWPLRLLPVAMAWPVAYMVASASWHNWRAPAPTV
jgi:hypothetical protein